VTRASRSAIVTGAASGIGRALASALLDGGHRVAATDINLDGLKAAAEEDSWTTKGGELFMAALDVRDPESWKSLVARTVENWGQLNLLFNVAGYLHPGQSHQTESEEVHRHIDVNLKGTIFGIQAAARQMVGQGQGHIINMASMAGLSPVPGLGLYAASKFGVRAYSLSACYELKKHGVAVTVICPDAVETPMLDHQMDYDDAALTFSGRRALTTDEITRTIMGRVLDRRPMEVMLPLSRGAVAKLASAFPQVAPVVEPILKRKGRRAQARAKKARETS
jgi:3-oxoacyl-[acyl-carrier protein] reductase